MCCIFIASKCLSWTVNRRLDEWVKLEQLDLDSVEAVVDEKVEDKVFYNFFFYLLFIFGNLNFCIQSGTFYSLKTSISWITMSTWSLFLFTWKLEGKKLCFLRVSAFSIESISGHELLNSIGSFRLNEKKRIMI